MFRAAASPEELALQDVIKRMFLAQDSAQILSILAEAAIGMTSARGVSAFLYSPDRTRLEGGDPALLPEPEEIDYVFQSTKPASIPHTGDRFITCSPSASRRAGWESWSWT